MVLKYPGATWDPLGVQTESRMQSHDILCFHTMVGSLGGTNSMFHDNGYGGTESHFGVGESKAQGMKQWQDLMYSADANLDGWHRVVSIETADYGGVFGKWDTRDAVNVPAWTDDQIDMLVALTVWFCRKESHANCPADWKCHQVGVPCVVIPDSKPGRRGLGYHKQGCDPYRVSGGEKWSTAYGKECPGSKRINQLKTVVAPRAAAILAGAGPEDDMSAADVKAINDHTDAKFQEFFNTFGIEGRRYSALQDTGNKIIEMFEAFQSVMQGRYSRSEQLHDAEMAALSPLQVLKEHEEVDDQLVQQQLNQLQSMVNELKQLIAVHDNPPDNPPA